MRWAALVVLLAGCKKPAPVWPTDLTNGWTRVTLKRGDRGVTAEFVKGTWRLAAPRKGDADPDAIDRLKLALGKPQVLAAAPESVQGPADWEIDLGGAKEWHVRGRRNGVGNPVLVTVAGLGEFTIAAVEMANQIPDPDELLTPGLWVGANGHVASFAVLEGPKTYEIVGHGDEWRLADGGTSARELDDFPGTIVGRQAIGHPTAPFEPVAKARLCIDSGECRVFELGKGNTARAPDSDAVELRASDWNLIINGP